MKKILILMKGMLILGMLIIPKLVLAQENRHPIEVADQQLKNTRKNLIVFVHTDWCIYCKAMENKTFNSKILQKLMKDSFFFTDLNAEEKREIVFAGKRFNYKPNGVGTGLHELAFVLGTIEGQVSYPTLIILNSAYEIIFQYNGFLSAKDFSFILTEIIQQTS